MDQKVPTKRAAAASPDARYPLTQDNGPWTIMACSFTGDGAEDQAQRLVQELRGKHRLTAYTYEGTFDFSKPVQGRGVDRYGGPQAMRYQNGKKITEIAVMIGDYQDVADPEAQKMLKKVKYMRPAALEASENQSTSQTLAAVRAIQRAVLPDDSEEKKKGPMGGAFVTTNPLLPRDYFVPKGIDKLVVEMNKGVKFGLLDCPGRYTVKVATFTGQVIVNQKQIESIEHGSSMKSRLAEAAEKAHKLTETLRAKGVQAYEFHDRYSSIVTIGSFNSVGTPRADGKTEINPGDPHPHEDLWCRNQGRARSGRSANRQAEDGRLDPLRRAADAGRSA